MTTRAEIVECARSWIDTPYRHQARVKGAGVDCIGLVIGVARELGLVAPAFDIKRYPRSPDGVSLMAAAREHMTEIPREAMQAGDVICITFDRDPQHFGILGDYRHGGHSIIHAYSTNRRVGGVVETRLMFSPILRFGAAFRLPGVA